MSATVQTCIQNLCTLDLALSFASDLLTRSEFFYKVQLSISFLSSELRTCVKAEVVVLGYPSLTVRMVSVVVKQY